MVTFHTITVKCILSSTFSVAGTRVRLCILCLFVHEGDGYTHYPEFQMKTLRWREAVWSSHTPLWCRSDRL